MLDRIRKLRVSVVTIYSKEDQVLKKEYEIFEKLKLSLIELEMDMGDSYYKSNSNWLFEVVLLVFQN